MCIPWSASQYPFKISEGSLLPFREAPRTTGPLNQVTKVRLVDIERLSSGAADVHRGSWVKSGLSLLEGQHRKASNTRRQNTFVASTEMVVSKSSDLLRASESPAVPPRALLAAKLQQLKRKAEMHKAHLETKVGQYMALQAVNCCLSLHVVRNLRVPDWTEWSISIRMPQSIQELPTSPNIPNARLKYN